MITIFNRAEAAITYDSQKQREIRNALKACGIKSRLRVRNTTNTLSRGRSNMAGINAGVSYEYKIYVKRSDLEAAVQIAESCQQGGHDGK